MMLWHVYFELKEIGKASEEDRSDLVLPSYFPLLFLTLKWIIESKIIPQAKSETRNCLPQSKP